jgi:hypothetical protein
MVCVGGSTRSQDRPIHDLAEVEQVIVDLRRVEVISREQPAKAALDTPKAQKHDAVVPTTTS